MAAKSNNFKIGIFILLAIALLIAVLLAFGAKSYFTRKDRFETAIVGDVAGLSVGSGVQFRGVPVGKVTKITFAWSQYPASKNRYIIVLFEIETDLLALPPGEDMKTAVKRATEGGLRAVVKGQGITGTSRLELEAITPPPEPPELDYTPKFFYIPSMPSQFSRMLESIEKSLQNLQRLDFASISDGATNALAGVGRFTDKLNKLDLETITTNANLLLVESRTTAGKVQGAIAQIRETLKGMKLDTLSSDANGLVGGLRESNVKLQTVLTKAGALPLQDILADLQQALQALNDVLLELKRYPSGFIFGQPPLPAKSVETPKK